ncbi:A/G-specific adenine glycosylase [Flavobacterium antarcticum]|uniref:A/G-specific adenine glycosylase n=1 Tax=Flavobacterium antarcticum TaxID=271155 RepID=UPI0003B7A593|nr:A/G-specific adenine glycosylase [Flavobacterium antarcticum]
MIFSKQLIKWYLQHKRNLPWRETQNPYLIWLSEIMLQQTRVAQGLPFYEAFVSAFPTVFDLANASEEQVLKLWQGLGYYSRARNLHYTAKFVANDLKGKFPNNYKQLLELKGVGDYTAAAIASFSFDEVVPVVDGNVFRVLSRVFQVETDISNASAKKEFQELALELMPKNNPAVFNQAIMEFGALQCVPKNPNCEICIFNDSCLALRNNKITALPVKTKKTKVTNRYLNYLIFEDEVKNTLIQKRSAKGIWHNLYEFPLIETANDVGLEEIIQLSSEEFSDKYAVISIENLSSVPVKHKLSHQNLSIQFWKISIKDLLDSGLPFSEVKKRPFPIVIYNFIEKELLD